MHLREVQSPAQAVHLEEEHLGLGLCVLCLRPGQEARLVCMEGWLV